MNPPLLTARAGGRTFRFALAGDASAPRLLLLVHGFPVGAGMWEPQIEPLARSLNDAAGRDWRVAALALPGYDGTQQPGEASIHDYASHVLAFLDHERADKVALCGLSMGGYVAFAMLREAPERIEALVLADTRSSADSEQAAEGRRRMLALLADRGPSAVADDVMPKLLGDTSQRTRPEVAARLRELIAAQPSETIAASIQAILSRPDSTPLLDTIRVPTLVLVGEEDTLTPPEEARQMHAAIPGASFVQIPQAGHMTNMETPGVFNAAVSGFLVN